MSDPSLFRPQRVAYVLNHHLAPFPGGKIVALCFSDNLIDIDLALSGIKVHPSELVLHLLFLLPQFQALMQSAPAPHSPPLPPLTGISAVLDPLFTFQWERVQPGAFYPVHEEKKKKRPVILLRTSSPKK